MSYYDDYKYQLRNAMSQDFQKLRNSLGSPVYEDDDVLLYHGDSLEIMAGISPQSIPLTVTSPPYNIGKSYETVLEIEDYVAWTERWINLVYELTAPTGAFWLNLGYMPIEGRAKAMPIPYLIWDRVPFFLIQEVVWNYGAGVAGKRFFSPRNEKFLWYVKNEEIYTFNLDDVRDPDVKYPNQRKNGKLRCNPLGKNPSDVWQIPKVTSGANRSSVERTAHPAQFPKALIERVILASSNVDDIVLDPFSGSGSTIETAVANGRKAIGIEIDRNYIDITVQRIKAARREASNAKLQTSLFDATTCL
jgi:adenine-specific DNA-methyltransferase